MELSPARGFPGTLSGASQNAFHFSLSIRSGVSAPWMCRSASACAVARRRTPLVTWNSGARSRPNIQLAALILKLIRARWVDHSELQIPHEVAEHAPRAISPLRLLRELWPSIPQPVCIHRGCNSIPVLPHSGGSTRRTASVHEFSRGDLLSESSPSPGMRMGIKAIQEGEVRRAIKATPAGLFGAIPKGSRMLPQD